MKFLAQLQQMAASEILNIVPSEIYREIKEKDPTPVFRASWGWNSDKKLVFLCY